MKISMPNTAVGETDSITLKDEEKKELKPGAMEAPSSGASGTAQVKALMGKNFLTKMRTPAATLTEFLSPVLLMVVLWLSYNMTENISFPARYYHALNLDLPLFWDTGIYDENEMEDFDMSETHRQRQRHLVNLNKEGSLKEDGLEDDSSQWTWGRLLNDMSAGGSNDYDQDEEFGLINDLLWMNQIKRGSTRERALEDGGGGILDLDEEEAEADSGDWYEEIITDLKKETVDKIDWEDVVDEIKDNFGDMWDESKHYILFSNYRSAYSIVNSLRLRLKDFLRRPMVVPSFGQYVWASKLLSSWLNVRQNMPRAFEDSSYGRQWGNLLTLGTMHLTPRDHPLTSKFILYLKETYPAARANIQIRVHDDHDEAMAYVMDHLDDERTWAVIDLSQLHDTGSGDDEIGGSFTIRLNHTTVPNTALVENYVASGLSTKYQRYYLSGYLTLQRTVNDFIMAENGCTPEVDPFFSMPMPTAAYDQNVFFMHVGYLLGLILVMAFLYPTSRLVQGLVEERETRMKETLLILGVRPWAHTTSWVLTSVISFVFISCFMSVVLQHVLTHTEFVLIWFWLALFGTASMSFCFFLASFFNKAKLAAVIGPMALFASLLPRFVFFGTNRYEAIGAKYAASILPGTALAFGADIVGDYEYGEQSVSQHIWVGDYSFGTSILFLAFDTVFYMVLAWYTEQVVPREYGAAPKPWYFPFTSCLQVPFWSRRFSTEETLADDSNDDLSVAAATTTANQSECIEMVTDPALIPRVFLNDLVKCYTKSKKPAVNHLNLTLYESQIISLLGHNGAGKTSTIAMLTGLYPPTSGEVSIYGHSICENMAKARQSIGICPQHDVLFDRLTVMEHLVFFSRIKGVSSDSSELKEKALEIGLTEDQLRTTAAALSGGNKRKLSVAIALCGNPKFLILDEPTSAMDPTARRRCWQVLRKKRKGRVILLTTHFMDEAERLSDRVAVMKDGELQCCGSPLFLKDKFNMGWNLTVVMDKLGDSTEVDHDYSNCRDLITNFLLQHVPVVKLARKSGRELTYRFPKGSEELFPDAFDAFEAHAKNLGVSSYGIENASFEEVFLMLAEKNGSLETELVNAKEATKKSGNFANEVSATHYIDTQSIASSKLTVESAETASVSCSESNSVVSMDSVDSKKKHNEFQSMSPLRQIGLLYWKRVTVQKRDIKGAVFTIIVPVVLVAMVILVLTASIIVSGPPLEMSPALYEKSSGSTTNGNASTQILIAGGASDRNQNSVQSQYLFMDSGLSFGYPKVDVTRLEDTKSSSELSNFLLRTYNDHDRPMRFGAFSVDDVVQVNINVNFTAFNEQIRFYSSKRRSHGAIKLRDQRVDLFEIFGSAGKNGRFFWKQDVASMAKYFYSRSNMPRHAKAPTASLHKLTRKALEGIVSSPSQQLEDIRAEYTDGLRSFADDLYNGVVAFLESPSFHDLERMITQMVSDFAGNTSGILKHTDKLEHDVAVMFEELVHSAFQKLPTQKIGEQKREIYRWDADLGPTVRSFMWHLGTLGKDEGRGTPSIYEVARTFAQDVSKIANETIFHVTGESYSIRTVEELLTNALSGAGNSQDFEREVVVRELSSMFEGVAKLYKMDGTYSHNIVKSTFDWLDARISDYSDDSIPRIPAKVCVALLVFADHILEKWDIDTISPDQAFGYLSEILGGNSKKMDGYINVRAKDITLDLGRFAVDFHDIWINTARGNIFNMDRTIPLTLPLKSLEALVPDNQTAMQFQFEIPAKTSLLHNSSSAHAVAAFNQAYMENRFKQCLGETRSSKTRLVSINHPLPLTAKQSLEIKVMLSVLAGLFILIPFCYIPATFIVFLVKERVCKSKHLQLVSGVNMSAYWTATYLWDLTLYFVLTMCILCVFLMYGSSADVFVGSKDAFLCTFALIFGYGVSALPFSYLLSRMFENSSTAQISVAGIGWLTGFVTVIANVTMGSLEKTEHIAAALLPFFRLFPAFNLGEGMMAMSTSYWYREIIGLDQYSLDWDVAGQNIAYIFSLALPYGFLVLVLEYSDDGGSGGLLGRGIRAVQFYWTKAMLYFYGIRMSVDGLCGAHYSLLGEEKNKALDDVDVVQERDCVMKNDESLRQTAPVVLKNLWKIYPPSVGLVGSLVKNARRRLACIFCACNPYKAVDTDNDETVCVPKQAVRGVSTVVQKGETYALLGANGAGKTTIIGMLTGDIKSTCGSAFVAGHDATGSSNLGVSEARKNIGFCPQKNPLLDLMTGRETLTMFAHLRGIPPNDVASTVEELLERLILAPHADKITMAYSGGNKRKLSLGLALIGDPKVLLIDESSSGLDPLARRRMWDLIEEAARSRSVILTTHSMQEAEALCTRVAIMVKGKFMCLGSVQHLKSKYMDGYSIDVFCRGGASFKAVDRLENEVLWALPGCRLSERHGRFLRFEVSNVSSLGLGTCFRRLQELRSDPELHVENYSVSQCSLEHVFVKLVNQEDPEDDFEKSPVSFSKASF